MLAQREVETGSHSLWSQDALGRGCWGKGGAVRQTVGKFVPCRGLILPNNPGSNQKPRAEEVGREGTRSEKDCPVGGGQNQG